MIVSIFDTETTGLIPNWNGPYSQPNMPRVVQFAARMLGGDNALRMDLLRIAEANPLITVGEDYLHCYVNPGVPISDGAKAATGITDELVGAKGITPETYINLLVWLLTVSDALICHNKSFDIKVICGELHNTKHVETVDKILTMPTGCTMKALTDVLKLPGKRAGWHKWPTLDEAYRKLIDPKGFSGAHDAMNDVNATAELYKWCLANRVNVWNN